MACYGEFSVSLELSLSLSDRTESAGQTGFSIGVVCVYTIARWGVSTTSCKNNFESRHAVGVIWKRLAGLKFLGPIGFYVASCYSRYHLAAHHR
jgi:hypothetical protein